METADILRPVWSASDSRFGRAVHGEVGEGDEYGNAFGKGPGIGTARARATCAASGTVAGCVCSMR